MIKKVMLAVSTLALAATAAPAIAQDQDNDNTTTGAAGNNSDTVVVNDLIDLFVTDNAADTFNDNDQDNDGNGSLNSKSLVGSPQTRTPTHTKHAMDELVDMDGEHHYETAARKRNNPHSTTNNENH